MIFMLRSRLTSPGRLQFVNSLLLHWVGEGSSTASFRDSLFVVNLQSIYISVIQLANFYVVSRAESLGLSSSLLEPHTFLSPYQTSVAMKCSFTMRRYILSVGLSIVNRGHGASIDWIKMRIVLSTTSCFKQR